jgi:AraC family transcriptional activator of tynA and feaB
MPSSDDRFVSTRHFTMDATPGPMRAQRFQSEMQSIFAVTLAVSSPPEKPLSAEVQGYYGRNLRFAALRFSSHSTASPHTAPSNESRLLVAYHKQGNALVSQGGRESHVEAGDFFVIDPSRPFHIHANESHVHSVYLKPHALRHVLPQWETLTARAIRPHCKPASLFTLMLDQLVSLAPSMTEETADDISEALPHLLAPALRSLENESEDSPTRLRDLHRQRILRFVRDNLWDSQLDANAIARGVQLSARHVYDLFNEKDGETLMKWVWKQRLQLCGRDLSEPALRSRSISEIAYTWGFSNVSHFSRAFKADYGIGPREFRKRQEAGR